jgi:hypothetical protein
MKRVATIIGLIISFLILCQTTVMSFHLINQPDVFSLNAGIILFGIEIFTMIVLVNYTYNLIIGWDKKVEESPEEVPTETPIVKKKKRNYYKPKKKSDFPIGSIEKKEKQI